VRNELNKSVKFIVQGSKLPNTIDDKLEDLIEDASTSSFIPEQHLCHSDILIYIYTSGTTGLPKPAVIKHSRYYASGVAYFIAASLTDNDIMYNSLPIYHGNGGMIVIALCFCEGVTIVLRKKFSASNFWKECAQYKCTVRTIQFLKFNIS
jgi:solute carrier family 27 (fatty acid transporter), member 1/4